MRLETTVWQGCFGDWQPLFIREYWLPLGDIAWQGFLQQGRGLVWCQVHAATATVDWGRTPVAYTARFLSQGQAQEGWQTLGLSPDSWPALEQAIATYNPAQDVILLLLGDSAPYITCLQGWAVPPPDCSRQMGDRRAEFNLTPAS